VRAGKKRGSGVVQLARVAAHPDKVNQLVRSLFEERSLLDRVRGQDHWHASFAQVAASREVH
jgi:hypothetical protein